MIRTLVLIPLALFAASCDLIQEKIAKDRAERDPAVTDDPPKPLIVSHLIVVGNGGRLAADGTSVLFGPLVVNHGIGVMPIYVEDSKGGVGLSCILLDKQKRLVAGGGIAIPDKFSGKTLQVMVDRDITGGSIDCKLVKDDTLRPTSRPNDVPDTERP